MPIRVSGSTLVTMDLTGVDVLIVMDDREFEGRVDLFDWYQPPAERPEGAPEHWSGLLRVDIAFLPAMPAGTRGGMRVDRTGAHADFRVESHEAERVRIVGTGPIAS